MSVRNSSEDGVKVEVKNTGIRRVIRILKHPKLKSYTKFKTMRGLYIFLSKRMNGKDIFPQITTSYNVMCIEPVSI